VATRIVCAGDCGVDFYVDDNTRWSGGCSLNVATNLHHLSQADRGRRVVEIAVVTALGSDADSHDVWDQIREVGPFSQVVRLPGTSSVQNIRLTKDGDRNFCGYDSGVLAQWQLSDGQLLALRDADLVMVPLYRQFERNFSEVRAAAGDGKLIVDFMDLSDYSADAELVRQVSRSMHAGFFGLEAADQTTLAAVQALSAQGSGLFVVTLGGAGSLVLQQGQIRHRVPAVPVAGALNTTGAGDAFAAAFMFSLVRHGSLPFALQAAAEHAAEVISGSLRVARFIGRDEQPPT
jgi:sugar/nucleoside kinase (ribokinase family)